MKKSQAIDLKPIEIDTPRAKRYKKLIKLTKIPGIKFFAKRFFDMKNSNGSPIPINVSLGTYERPSVRSKGRTCLLSLSLFRISCSALFKSKVRRYKRFGVWKA